jgi:hypothetical protein
VREPLPDCRGSLQPSVLLSLGLLALTILAWPGLVQRFISLDWQIGNMRPWLFGLQAILGIATIVCWRARQRVDAAWRRAFPTRRLVFTLVALLGSGAAALGAAEVVLRFAHWPFQARVYTAANAMGRFDPDTGWSYIPNRSVVRVAGSERKPITYHFDRFGTRVGVAGLQRDPTRPSLLLLGCSFTLGEAVPYEETFAAQLEARPGFPLQVVNGGVGGFGPARPFR